MGEGGALAPGEGRQPAPRFATFDGSWGGLPSSGAARHLLPMGEESRLLDSGSAVNLTRIAARSSDRRALRAAWAQGKREPQ
jgi:hypothetical protein